MVWRRWKKSSYFLGLEKYRQSKKLINELYDERGDTTTKQSKILELEVNYYKNLYQSTAPCNTKIKKYINETNLKNQLNDKESTQCEGKFSVKECTDAIFKMKLNRAPGLDGLTVEFYQKFWTEIKNFAVKVFNYSYDKKELSNSQKKGAISLIYKKMTPSLLTIIDQSLCSILTLN